jgi:nucleotide-binding universal stress UspA family protein
MAKLESFSVLVATDGSREARAAVVAAAMVPWPAHSLVHAVIARRSAAGEWPKGVGIAVQRRLERLAAQTRRELAKRWPRADVTIVDSTPVGGILAQARKVRARVIVLGSGGRGVIGRLLLGSVSRDVVRRASCAVMVIKGRPRAMRRLVIGLDGSPNARHALSFVAALQPPEGGHVTLVRAVERVRVQTLGLMPAAVRASIAHELAAVNAQQMARAKREMQAASDELEGAGWTVKTEIRSGVPLAELLAAANDARAELLVVGARGVGGVKRLLLGSVALGALSHSRVSVLVVR